MDYYQILADVLLLLLSAVTCRGQEAPRFTFSPSSPRIGARGDRIVLNCEASGNPSPTLSWKKDGRDIVSSGRIRLQGSSLTIEDLQDTEVGLYRCIYTNGFGVIGSTTMVAIEGGAIISQVPRNQNVSAGSTVELPCPVHPSPTNITYTWYREATPVLLINSLSDRMQLVESGSLRIFTVSPNDTGWYRCEVYNGIGARMSVNSYLTVQSTNIAIIPYTELTLAIGQRAEIPCHVSGFPPPTKVTWRRMTQLIDVRSTRFDIDQTRWSLIIHNVMEQDSGSYMCTPQNTVGVGQASGYVRVTTAVAPMFIEEPDPHYSVITGSSIYLPCTATLKGTTLPRRNISWVKVDENATVSEDSLHTVYPNGSLAIRNVRKSDGGIYRCSTVGAKVNSMVETTLIVESTTPHAPVNMTAEFAHFDITLEWIPGFNGGFLQSFVVMFRQTGVKVTQWQSLRAGNRSKFTMYNLQPDTHYEMKVYGENQIGSGPSSLTLAGKTLGFVPGRMDALPTDSRGNTFFPPIVRPIGPTPGAPRNLTGSYVIGGLVKLSWLSPESTDVPILYYQVEYWRDTIDAQWQLEDPVYANVTRVIFYPGVSATNEQVKYFFRVRAYGLLANSDYSNAITMTIPESVPPVLSQGAIIGITLAALAFVAMVIVIIVIVSDVSSNRKKRKRKNKNDKHNGVQYTQTPQFSTGTSKWKSFYPYSGGRFTVDSDQETHVYVIDRNPDYNATTSQRYNSQQYVPPNQTLSSNRSTIPSYNPYADPSLMHGFYDVRMGRQLASPNKRPAHNAMFPVIQDSSDGQTTSGTRSQGSRYVGQFEHDPEITDWFSPHHEPRRDMFQASPLDINNHSSGASYHSYDKNNEILLKPSLPRHSSIKPNYYSQQNEEHSYHDQHPNLFDPSLSTVHDQSYNLNPYAWRSDPELLAANSPNSIEHQFNNSFRQNYKYPERPSLHLRQNSSSSWQQTRRSDRTSTMGSSLAELHNHYDRDRLVGTVERVRSTPKTCRMRPTTDSGSSNSPIGYAQQAMTDQQTARNSQAEISNRSPSHLYNNEDSHRLFQAVGSRPPVNYYYSNDQSHDLYAHPSKCFNDLDVRCRLPNYKPRLSNNSTKTASSAMTSGLGRSWSHTDESFHSRPLNSVGSVSYYESHLMGELNEPPFYARPHSYTRQYSSPVYTNSQPSYRAKRPAAVTQLPGSKPIQPSTSTTNYWSKPNVPSDSVDENYEFDPILTEADPIDFFHIYQMNKNSEESFEMRPPLYAEQTQGDDSQRFERLRREYLDFREKQQETIRRVYRLESDIL